VKRFVRDNGLGLFCGLIFVLALGGQAVAGCASYNNQQLSQDLQTLSLGSYLISGSFAADVMENWQSEYLQLLLYILATVWMVQRGSPESKKPGEEGRMSDEDQKLGEHLEPDSPVWAKVGGLRTFVFSRSLSTVMGLFFFGTWAAQSIAGRSAYNFAQLRDQEHTVSWLGYITSADFWNRTLQNWQSEFLAVGSMAVLSVYLRERGSSESKPVGEPHTSTGVTP